MRHRTLDLCSEGEEADGRKPDFLEVRLPRLQTGDETVAALKASSLDVTLSLECSADGDGQMCQRAQTL